jgi:hypothetical protein
VPAPRRYRGKGHPKILPVHADELQPDGCFKLSKYKGLSRCKISRNDPSHNHTPRCRNWQVRIYVAGGSKYLGTFKEELEAALAYDKEARLHGKPLNFEGPPREEPPTKVDKPSGAADNSSSVETAPEASVGAGVAVQQRLPKGVVTDTYVAGQSTSGMATSNNPASDIASTTTASTTTTGMAAPASGSLQLQQMPPVVREVTYETAPPATVAMDAADGSANDGQVLRGVTAPAQYHMYPPYAMYPYDPRFVPPPRHTPPPPPPPPGQSPHQPGGLLGVRICEGAEPDTGYPTYPGYGHSYPSPYHQAPMYPYPH